jgi:hypothetical protein
MMFKFKSPWSWSRNAAGCEFNQKRCEFKISQIIMQVLYWPSLGIFIAQGPWQGRPIEGQLTVIYLHCCPSFFLHMYAHICSNNYSIALGVTCLRWLMCLLPILTTWNNCWIFDKCVFHDWHHNWWGAFGHTHWCLALDMCVGLEIKR